MSETSIGKALGDVVAGYRDRDNGRAARGLVSAIDRVQQLEDAVAAAAALIDEIEGPFGWATARNALGIRLKDASAYVPAYLAIRAALSGHTPNRITDEYTPKRIAQRKRRAA